MTHRPAVLKQSDLTRYAKAMRAAGVEEWRVEIESPDGTRVSIVAGAGAGTTPTGNDFDAMIGKLP